MSDEWMDKCIDCGHWRSEHRDDRVLGEARWCIGQSGLCSCMAFTDEATAAWLCTEHDREHADRDACIHALRDEAEGLRDEIRGQEEEADRLERLADDLERVDVPVDADDLRMAWVA